MGGGYEAVYEAWADAAVEARISSRIQWCGNEQLLTLIAIEGFKRCSIVTESALFLKRFSGERSSSL
jgi:hypothetical protein